MKTLSYVKEGHIADFIIVQSMLDGLRLLDTDRHDLVFKSRVDEDLQLLEKIGIIDETEYLPFYKCVFSVNVNFDPLSLEPLKKWIKNYLTEIAPDYYPGSYLDDI